MAEMTLAQGPAVLENVEECVDDVLFALYLLISAVFLWRLVTHLRRQHLEATHRRSQTSDSQNCRTAVEALSTSPVALSAVRLRQARAALPPLTSAPAASPRVSASRERSDG